MAAIGYFKFVVDGEHFVYDTTTNAIIAVPEAVHRILDEFLSLGADEAVRRHGSEFTQETLADALAFLQHARDRGGLFKPFFPKRFGGLLDEAHLRRLLSSGLQNLVLNLTDECNSRCRYCCYSGAYLGERTHGATRMSWEVARRSIDYFLERRDQDEPNTICFYGGEPLLEWMLLRQSVEHIRRSGPEELKMAVATNGLLLDEERMSYLVDHDIGLWISLDGPQAIHDAWRVTGTGEQTHGRVIQVLRFLHDTHPEYYRERVLLNCTLDNNHDLMDVFRYFNDHLFDGVDIAINPVKPLDQDFHRISPSNLERHRRRLDALTAAYIDSYSTGASFNCRFFRALFPDLFGRLARRKSGLAGEDEHPGGVCVPGVTKLFVDSKGQFHSCEKCTAAGTEIGSVDSGIELSKVRALLARFVALSEKLCQECWAYRLCSHCLVQSSRAGVLDESAKADACVREREQIARGLRRFMTVWRGEPPEAVDNPYSLRTAVSQAEPPE